MNKKTYQAYNRQVTALNAVNRNVADLEAHIQFLSQTRNVDELEKLNSQLSSFLDEIKSKFIATLPDYEAECETDACERS
ncbi:MAG: hypothetical protein E7126_06100 [Rikenellaceae bacterium]|nr:hypothetical protein [Rikenellaceae bacterium]